MLMVLAATGVFLIALALLTGRRARTIRATFIALVVIGLVAIGSGVWLFLDFTAPSAITVGPGYVNVQSPDLSGAGNMNITTDQITVAYIGQIGSGNLTLSKQYGTNYDDFNIGHFTLANGSKAYVVSSNSTDLVVLLKNGEYVILGTSSTDALATSFSQQVFPVESQSVGFRCL